MRDYQRSKVYRWEDRFVLQFDTRKITIEEARDFVHFVWCNLGKNYPPKVDEGRSNCRTATGCRLKIVLPENLRYRWVLLHELAHAILENHEVTDEWSDTEGAEHGPVFVKTYVDLLDRFLRIPKPMLWYTLKEAGVDYDL